MSSSKSELLLEDKREEIYDQLTQLLDIDGPLWTIPPEFSVHFDELKLVALAQQYMALDTGVKAEGRTVICSAGPPGAGKSGAMTSLNLASNYRKIDPDVAKDLILIDAMQHSLMDYREAHILADGMPVSPRELAWHVHEISTRVTDTVRHLALDAGENVIIDGTLSWAPLGSRYIDELYTAGYQNLTVVDVELPYAEALKRARKRWWDGRNNDQRLGGRFVPAVAIRSCYKSETDSESVCAINAKNLAIQAGDELGSGILIQFDVDRETGAPEEKNKENFGATGW